MLREYRGCLLERRQRLFVPAFRVQQPAAHESRHRHGRVLPFGGLAVRLGAFAVIECQRHTRRYLVRGAARPDVVPFGKGNGKPCAVAGLVVQACPHQHVRQRRWNVRIRPVALTRPRGTPPRPLGVVPPATTACQADTGRPPAADGYSRSRAGGRWPPHITSGSPARQPRDASPRPGLPRPARSTLTPSRRAERHRGTPARRIGPRQPQQSPTAGQQDVLRAGDRVPRAAGPLPTLPAPPPLLGRLFRRLCCFVRPPPPGATRWPAQPLLLEVLRGRRGRIGTPRSPARTCRGLRIGTAPRATRRRSADRPRPPHLRQAPREATGRAVPRERGTHEVEESGENVDVLHGHADALSRPFTIRLFHEQRHVERRVVERHACPGVAWLAVKTMVAWSYNPRSSSVVTNWVTVYSSAFPLTCTKRKERCPDRERSHRIAASVVNLPSRSTTGEGAPASSGNSASKNEKPGRRPLPAEAGTKRPPHRSRSRGFAAAPRASGRSPSVRTRPRHARRVRTGAGPPAATRGPAASAANVCTRARRQRRPPRARR